MKRILATIIALLLVVSINLLVSQEREPNNQKNQADSITGTELRGAISHSGDVDWFVLNGQEGSNPTFMIEHAPGVDFDFEVYSNHQRVGHATGSRSGDSVTCHVPGRCYIKVYSARGSGGYRITWGGHMQSDEREPNDNRGQADRIPQGKFDINGVISNASDVDWFQLSGQEGSNPTFIIEHAAGSDIDFEVYSGDDVVGRATGSSSGDSVTCNVPGTCYIKVWGAGNAAGPYHIRIQPRSSAPTPVNDEREPNDNKGQADRIPQPKMEINGFIANSNDVDWFALSGQEGSNPTFVIEHNPGMDIDFEVYSGDNSVGTATGSHSGDSIRCHVPGNCYIRVWGSGNAVGPYRIRIQPNNVLPVVSDEREPNDNKGQADRISQPKMEINGVITHSGDVDWFQLSGQEGSNPTFIIEHSPAVDFDFEVYSGEDSVGRATGSNSGDSVTCNVPGTCFIRVWSARGTGSYQIRIVR